MVGAMLAVAKGELAVERLEELLSHPELGRVESEIPLATSGGLCLTKMVYPPQCMYFPLFYVYSFVSTLLFNIVSILLTKVGVILSNFRQLIFFQFSRKYLGHFT